eukprot:4052745-Lingulodinium_polyedra.AAC.1
MVAQPPVLEHVGGRSCSMLVARLMAANQKCAEGPAAEQWPTKAQGHADDLEAWGPMDVETT